jgi:hypothetical protein
MAKTQWHPLFAELLKLLLGDYYDVRPEVPVSEMPRRGDFLVVRRQDGPQPPFAALWSHLREWNVIEFKGLTDHAEIGDLELLVHVGTGLTVKINEERKARGLAALASARLAFWYVAPLITDSFAGDDRSGVLFKYEAEGVWSGWAVGHRTFLVSVRDLPRDVDSLPLQLLDEALAPSLAEVFAANQGLAERFAGWLIEYRPNLWREVVIMNPKVPTPISWEEAAKLPGAAEWLIRNRPEIWREVVAKSREAPISQEEAAKLPGLDEILDAMETERLVKALLKKLSPEQVQELLRRQAQGAPPPPPAGEESGPQS